MTGEVWSAVVHLNLFATLAAVAVMALRPAALALFGAQVRYGLWALVPITALASLWPGATRTVMVRVPASLPLSDPMPVTDPAPGLSGALIAIWLAGVAASLVFILWRQRVFLRQAKRHGPAVVGVIKPRLHLPADFEARFTAAERDLILAHERTHLERQDARLNGLMALTQCVCWFNPVIHLAAWLARQDQEMACDEAVMARFPASRKTYAEAMLKTQLASVALPLGCYWPSRGMLPLERRIQQLKTATPGLARRLTGAGIVAGLTASAGYAAWAAQPPHTMVLRIASLPTPAPHGFIAMRGPTLKATVVYNQPFSEPDPQPMADQTASSLADESPERANSETAAPPEPTIADASSQLASTSPITPVRSDGSDAPSPADRTKFAAPQAAHPNTPPDTAEHGVTVLAGGLLMHSTVIRGGSGPRF
jgi:beta-lactamase regulating signal transducer with metallopeptidase domain